MQSEAATFPLQSHLGMSIESPAAGRARATVALTEDLHNPNGVVHGAVLFAMADTSMGAATMSILGEGQACASIEVHIRFLRPVASGELIAETEVVRAGRRIVQLDSSISDDTGELVATATGSFVVISAPSQ
jgi:acyl-CoA thioesterase